MGGGKEGEGSSTTLSYVAAVDMQAGLCCDSCFVPERCGTLWVNGTRGSAPRRILFFWAGALVEGQLGRRCMTHWALVIATVKVEHVHGDA